MYAGSPNEKSELVIDSNNVVHLMGSFQGTQTYGSFSLSYTNGNLFVLSINAEGTVTNALQMASKGSTSTGSLFMDDDDNLYVTGSFNNVSDFGDTTLETGGMFITKINPAGTFLWAKRVSGITMGSTITADAAGNVYASGFYYGTAQFGGQTIQSETEMYSHFILKLNPDGNLIWINSYNSSDDTGNSHPQIVIADTGQLYYMFGFRGPMTFMGTDYTSQSPALKDMILCRLNSNGTFAWVKQFNRFDYKNDGVLFADSTGLYLTGGVSWDVFDGIPLDNDSAPEILVAKITDGTPPELDAQAFSITNITAANPVSNEAHISLGTTYNTITADVYNLAGQHVSSFSATGVDALHIPVTGSAGLYIIKLQLDGASHVLKIIKK